MRAIDGIGKDFSAAGDSGAVLLSGGRYQLQAHSASWGGGNVQVQGLGQDGSTYVAHGTLKLSADGYVTDYLAQGKYKLTLTTTTAAIVSLRRVPGE